MKKGALAAGIILLVIGSMGYLMTTQSVSQGQTVRGEVERFFSSGSQNQYQQAGFAQLIFGGLAVVGFVLTIYGSAAKSNHTKTTSSEFYCKYCSQPFPTYLGMNKHRENCDKKPEKKLASPEKIEVKLAPKPTRQDQKNCSHKDFWFSKENMKFCTDCGKELGPRFFDSEKPQTAPAQKQLDAFLEEKNVETGVKETINDLDQNEKALGILKERLAKGEISINEFHELKKEVIQ